VLNAYADNKSVRSAMQTKYRRLIKIDQNRCCFDHKTGTKRAFLCSFTAILGCGIVIASADLTGCANFHCHTVFHPKVSPGHTLPMRCCVTEFWHTLSNRL
jgi:hypothetical protein